MLAPRGGSILHCCAILLLVSAVGSACAVLHAPLAPPAVTPEGRFHLSAEGLEIEAQPIRTWEQNWELFDDNLPEIGLLAVWVELRDTSSKELDLARAKWELRRGADRLRPLSLDGIYENYYKRHHTRFYGVKADRDAREVMGKWLLDAGRLRPSESRRGFLFFKTASAQTPDWNRGAVLTLSRFAHVGGARNDRRLELPLFHARP